MSDAAEPQVLVIGYGNPLRRDDGAGCAVADAVGRPAGLAVHQLTPELAEAVSRTRFAVFVDASRQLQPGTVEWRIVGEDPAGAPLTHHMSAGALLTLAAKLYGSAPQAWTASIGGEDFGFGEGLTPDVAGAVGAVVDKIRREYPCTNRP